MQKNANGIPCNVPLNYQRKPQVNVNKPQKKKKKLMHFYEMTKQINGLECTVIGPLHTAEHRTAIQQNYQPVHEFSALVEQ